MADPAYYLDPFERIVACHFGDTHEEGEVTHLTVSIALSPRARLATPIAVVSSSGTAASVLYAGGARTLDQIDALSTDGYTPATATEFIPPEHLINGHFGDYWTSVEWLSTALFKGYAYIPTMGPDPDAAWSIGIFSGSLTGSVPVPDPVPVTIATRRGWQGSLSEDPERDSFDGVVEYDGGHAEVPMQRLTLTGSDSGIPYPHPIPGKEHNFKLGTSVTVELRYLDFLYWNFNAYTFWSEVAPYEGGKRVLGAGYQQVYTDGNSIGPSWGYSHAFDFSALRVTRTQQVAGVPGQVATFVPIGYSTITDARYYSTVTILLKRSDLI